MSILVNLYKKFLIHRYDDNGYIKYFQFTDFKGLKAEKFSFRSGNNTLVGNYYYYDGYKDDELIIFCHGIGGGHRSYMREIEHLCQCGYKVLAYDNTGCFDSQGESIICISQSLSDLDSAIRTLKSSGEFQKYKKVHVIGHSWGGFAAGNIANYHSDIDKIVVISGFVSVEQLIKAFLKGNKGVLKKHVFKTIYNFEKEMNPDYVGSSTLDALKSGNSEFLLAYSKDDPNVPFEYSIRYINENFNCENVTQLIYEDRKHNPNYTLDAVTYMNDVFGKYKKVSKSLKMKTPEAKKEYFKDVDWLRMTNQDKDFWEQVCKFLDN